MPQTRSQYRQWVQTRGAGYETSQDSEDECEACASQGSNVSYGGNSYNGELDEPNNNVYGRNDRCKRHRHRDNEPYTQQVVAYRRRQPIR